MSIWDFVPLGIVKWIAREKSIRVRVKIGPMGEWYRAHYFAGVVVSARTAEEAAYHAETEAKP